MEITLEIIKAIVLGMVQGLSEFLPISSSGHLVLVEEILNFRQEGITFEIIVHFGTLLAIFVVFRDDLLKMLKAPFQKWIYKMNDPEITESLNWVYFVLIGSIPAALVGNFLKDRIESFFADPVAVLVFLSITGLIMFSSRFIKKTPNELNINRGFLIGVAQAFAILPGISRSGSTIVTGLALGVNREKVARFSFILSIPAIVGASLLQVTEMAQSNITGDEILQLLAGALSAFASGYFAIIWLLDLVKKGKLEWFAYYCWFIAAIGFTWYFVII